jgi:hypothetical protein
MPEITTGLIKSPNESPKNPMSRTPSNSPNQSEKNTIKTPIGMNMLRY